MFCLSRNWWNYGNDTHRYFCSRRERESSAWWSRRFAHHMTALLLVSVFTFLEPLVIYKITDFIIPLRVEETSEELGLIFRNTMNLYKTKKAFCLTEGFLVKGLFFSHLCFPFCKK